MIIQHGFSEKGCETAGSQRGMSIVQKLLLADLFALVQEIHFKVDPLVFPNH